MVGYNKLLRKRKGLFKIMVNKIRNGVVWIRTPKCATSTIAKHLENFCNWKGMKYTPHDLHGDMAPTNFINLGHLYSGDVNWQVTLQENRGVMGSIRNPLDRFISHYKHRVKLGMLSNIKNISSQYINHFDSMHFESYFRGVDNYLCKYLGVGDDNGWSKELLDERYDFFFVSEYLHQSLEKFEKLTGYTFENKGDKVNVSDNFGINLTDDFLETFKENNKNDYELYNYIIEKYGYK